MENAQFFESNTGGHTTSLPNQLILLQNFWQTQLQSIERGFLDFKTFQLPLARIKKVMKTDEDVKMISAEAPIIFAKACEIFILELTLRAWIQTEESKRRTLQRNDVAAAITKNDTFDFLIDIVPREDNRMSMKKDDYRNVASGVMQDPMASAYYYQSMPMQGHAGAPSYTSNDQILYMRQQQQQQDQMQQLQLLRQQQKMHAATEAVAAMNPSATQPMPNELSDIGSSLPHTLPSMGDVSGPSIADEA